MIVSFVKVKKGNRCGRAFPTLLKPWDDIGTTKDSGEKFQWLTLNASAVELKLSGGQNWIAHQRLGFW